MLTVRSTLTYFAATILAFAIVAWLTWGGPRPPRPVGSDGAPANVAAIRAGERGPASKSPPADTDQIRTMHGVVGAREVDVWTLRFATAETARIWIEGEDRSRLDCVAQDASGNLLDVDADTTGRCQLAWVPSRTGGYRIMIRNAGSTPARYQLVAR